jgi:FkbM family methyltransferase
MSMALESLKPTWREPADMTGGTPVHAVMRRILPLSMRWKLAELAFNAKTQVRLANDLAREVGWNAVAKIRYAQQSHRLTQSRRLNKIQLPGYKHPLYYRQGTSDPLVIEQVFARHEYACVADESQVKYIIDCGANVGYTSFFLLNRYPAAKVIVVEPATENLAVCRKNLAPFEDRVHFVQAGVWEQSGPMTLVREGAEWAFTVRPSRQSETPDFQAVTIGELMARYQFPRMDLLKVDIEGSETSVFKNSPEWLSRTKTLVIELHGDDCETAVVSSLNGCEYDRSQSGELTVFRNICTPKKAGIA